MKPKPKEWMAGLKVYEPGRPIEEVARELGFESDEGFQKLASNENELGVSPLAKGAMREHISEMHRYPDGGCYSLAEKLGHQLELSPDNILFGNGSNELIEFLGHLFLKPGTNLVMGAQAFGVYHLVAAMFNADVIKVPMPDYRHDLDAIFEAVTPQTRLVAVCNPNNPTGTAVAPEELRSFVERLPKDVLLIIDEAYIELLEAQDRPDTLSYIREGRENLVLLRTFSKAYGLAGLRIGYALACPKMIELMNKVRQPFNANAMAQAAALAALDDSAHLESTRQMVAEGRRYLSEEFDKLGLEYVPSLTNFMLLRVGDGRKLFEKLKRRKIIVRPMDGYGLADFIRVSIGKQEQNELVIRELKDILGNGN